MLKINELIGKIPSDKNAGWVVEIDGEEQKVGMIKISSKFGTFVYGLLAAGYDSWYFYEAGGGGAVTLPYSINENGELYVGLLPEKRPNMGGIYPCVIGGFLKPGESHAAAQSREADEEAGLNLQAEALHGVPTNSNRAFFVTDLQAGEGVNAFGMRIPFELLSEAENGSMCLKTDTSLPGYAKSASVIFLPWKEAARLTPDSLARSAMLLLVAEVL
jgi:ADP-ribose pyrophosphatase YjhB (NUDIX family)